MSRGADAVDDPMPYALRVPEAFAQLHSAWWVFVEKAVPFLADVAQSKRADALNRAFDLRAELVGREQACRDYLGWPRETT
jgi:hypothetical protein